MRRWASQQNSTSGRRYKLVERTLVYLKLGTEREVIHGPSLSATLGDSRVSGPLSIGKQLRLKPSQSPTHGYLEAWSARHGERFLPRGVPICNQEELRGMRRSA